VRLVQSLECVMRKKRKKKFKHIFTNQTKLGHKLGISRLAVGKLLVEYGLKDRFTLKATPKALDNGLAVYTPLKDGTPFYM